MGAQIITSKDNPRIKHVRKLLADKQYRYQMNEYAIEGVRALDDLRTAKELFVCEGTAVPELQGATVYVVSQHVFAHMTATENGQGIIAVAPLSLSGPDRIDPAGRYVLLDRLQDPGNMGTIIRTACAFALRGIIITPGCVDPFSPKVVRSAAGALGKPRG
jgi:TrmH family RNA methyltransferase